MTIPEHILNFAELQWLQKKPEARPLTEVFPGCFASDQYFWYDVPQVACFEVQHGKQVAVFPAQPVNENLIKLYLHGLISGVILHQRQHLALHAGAFVYQNKGVVICGESEAGKSSLNLAFCKDGAQFLADDLAPLHAGTVKPFIQPVGEHLKIWKDSLYQLDLQQIPLPRVEADNEKYFMQMHESNRREHNLHVIIELRIDAVKQPQVELLTGPSAFETIRNQVYRKELLRAMPETEKACLLQLARLVSQVPVFRITRPKKIHIREMQQFVAELIQKL